MTIGDELLHSSMPMTDKTTYDYHRNGLLNSITYPDGQTEYHQYDEANRLTAYIDAQGHRTEYRYDIDSSPIERINALGHTFRYKYGPHWTF